MLIFNQCPLNILFKRYMFTTNLGNTFSEVNAIVCRLNSI